MTETINSLVESRRVPALEAVSSSLLAVRQARLTDEGISCTLNRLGSVQEIGGLKPPGYTQAVREQGYESFYRVLTAVAHGVFYGLAWLTQSVQQPTSAGSGLLNPIADQDQVIACTAAVISSFLDATDRHAKLFGWRRVEWDSWRTETRRAVGRLLRKLG